MSKLYLAMSVCMFLGAAFISHADDNPYSPENNPYSPRNNPYSPENNRYNMGSFIRESSSITAPPAVRVQRMHDLPGMAVGIINTYNDAGEVVGSRLVIINGEQ